MSGTGFVRRAYRDVGLYRAEQEDCTVLLSGSVNLWDAPPAARRALRRVHLEMAAYPSPYADSLKEAIAAYIGVAPEAVVTGCGSDDVLDSAFRAFAEPGDQLAHIDPTFAMVPVFARLNGLKPLGVPLTPAYDADVASLLATGARIIYLCSPNNPTGGVLSRAAIEQVVEGAPGMVILDEAYAEFAGFCHLDLLGRSERLLIVRTLSKAFGLAGLRIGFATGAPWLVAEVEKSRGPYKVNALSERVAIAALDEGLPWVQARAEEVRILRTRFVRELEAMGLTALSSGANFVMVPMLRAPEVARSLRRHGVAVCIFEGLPPIGQELQASEGGALRIAIGPWRMMVVALRALREAVSLMGPLMPRASHCAST